MTSLSGHVNGAGSDPHKKFLMTTFLDMGNAAQGPLYKVRLLAEWLYQDVVRCAVYWY